MNFILSLVDRINNISKIASVLENSNKQYKETESKLLQQKERSESLGSLFSLLHALEKDIKVGEKEWRDWAVKDLENNINTCLAIVFPDDKYCIHLDVSTKYGKVRLFTSVTSNCVQDKLTIKGTQGRLFQQTVTFGAILAFMKFVGTNTIYIDEAFSGTSQSNWDKVEALLQYALNNGANIVMISQNADIGLPANVYSFSRDTENCSHITYERRE